MGIQRDIEGANVTGLTPSGIPAMGLDRTNNLEHILDVDANGKLNIAPVAPGGNISTDADVSVGAGATVSLGAPPATARVMTVQNTGAVAVRIREVAGGAGRGILLNQYDVATYEGAIERLEAENLGAAGTTVAVQYETA